MGAVAVVALSSAELVQAFVGRRDVYAEGYRDPVTPRSPGLRAAPAPVVLFACAAATATARRPAAPPCFLVDCWIGSNGLTISACQSGQASRVGCAGHQHVLHSRWHVNTVTSNPVLQTGPLTSNALVMIAARPKDGPSSLRLGEIPLASSQTPRDSKSWRRGPGPR